MKRFVTALVLGSMLYLSSPVSGKNIKVPFATGEWPPYTSAELPGYGAAAALISAICEAAGIEPEFRFYPWARAELEVKNGSVFAAFPYAETESRKKDFDFSDVMFYGANHFIYNTNNPRTEGTVVFDSIEDLKDYRIGAIRGSFFENKLRDSGLDLETTATVDQGFLKLNLGRIDLFLDNYFILNDAIRRLYPYDREQFKILPKVIGGKISNVLIVSREYENAQLILDKFNAGLATIKSNGVYDQIVSDYKLVYFGE